MKQRVHSSCPKILTLSISILALFYSVGAGANGLYNDLMYSMPDSVAGEYRPSHHSFQDLASSLTGVDLEWVNIEKEQELSSPASIFMQEVKKDFNLLAALPTNEEQLEALLLSRANTESLPILLNHSPYFVDADFHGHSLFLSELRETEDGLMATLVFSALTPEDQLLHFIGQDIPISGLGMELCDMRMMLEADLNTADPEFPITIKGSMNTDSASYVLFNCDGFESFQLLCEYRFPTKLVKPVESTHNSVRALFKITSEKLGDFIGEVSIDPFEIQGLDDVQFLISHAVVDYSTGRNHDAMKSAINSDWDEAVKERYENSTWRGFFMKELSIKLPEAMPGISGERITLAMKDVMADHGSGITGKLMADPQVKGSISGWGISLDSLLLEVITNSLKEFKLTGDINIPIMTGTFKYAAVFGTEAEGQFGASFTLGLAGSHNLPFLNNAGLKLQDGSMAGISYRAGKFEPHAALSGSITLEIGDPSVTIPVLGFEGFKINDPSAISHGNQKGWSVTGGLDKISIKAFSLGRIEIANMSGGIGFEGDSNNTSEGSKTDTDKTAGNNSKLSGFPITINGIGLESVQEGNKSYYKLKFDIGLNFAAGKSTFGPSGSFAIWGNLNFAELITATPWEAISYHKTTVESIYIKASLGKVALEGGIRLINNDLVYGSGFKGGIRLKVKLPAAEFSVACVGQFGTVNGYRYFFVDAEVGFSTGLQLGNTGLAIYGFSGGIFYNMERTPAGLTKNDLGEEAADKDIFQMPAEVEEIKMTKNLLEPGQSLSGIIYNPKNGTTSFQVGLTFGLSAPQMLLADVAFGMTMNTTNGWTVEEISFKGAGYFMNPGVTKRKKAAVAVISSLIIDINNEELVGSFGMNVNVPPGVNANMAFITGSYNIKNPTTNFYLKFGGPHKEFFFFAGKPKEPMRVNFQLTKAIRLASVQAYFMAAANYEMPPMESLQEIFKNAGLTLPKELQDFGGRVFTGGDAGVAFGARLSFGGSYRFLMFRASLMAFAGFDASLLHYYGNVPCGDNGTFGIENWYMIGQAYAGFRGSLDMHIDLGILYKGDINIATLEAGVALRAELPNPTYLMGFLYGRYSVLGGLIKGHFSFKFEVGEKCSTLPDYNPMAGIPLIQDISPKDRSNLEIYQGTAATFFVPIGDVMEFDVPLKNGKTEHRKYKCYLNTVSTKIAKQGGNVSIPVNITYQDNNKTAVFKPTSLLEPYTNYEFTVRVEWRRIENGREITSDDYEEKKVTFRTGGRPQTIIPEAVAYLAPGYRQRYWHKNYAQPMLEFKQNGWNYLFPRQRNVKAEVSPISSLELLALIDMGFQINQFIAPNIQMSKVIPVKYICRVTDLQTNETTDLPIDELPGSGIRYIFKPIIKTYIIEGKEYPFFAGIEMILTNGKRVSFAALNQSYSINLNKGHLYSLEIIRVPVEISTLPTTIVTVNKSESIKSDNDTEVLTRETTQSHITPVKMSVINKALNSLNQEEVLYSYHFGVSQYNSLAEKFNSVRSPIFQIFPAYSILTPPKPWIPKFNFGISAQYNQYAWLITGETFDKFDEQYFLANYDFARGERYANTIRDYLRYRTISDLGGNSGKNELELQRWEIPFNIFFPSGSNRMDWTISGQKSNYDKLSAYAQWVTDYYLNEKERINNVRFEGNRDKEITESEINNKALKNKPGSYLWLVYGNYEARTIRNSLAFYQLQIQCIDILKHMGKQVTRTYASEYNTLRRYYMYSDGSLRSKYTLFWDAYGNNRLYSLQSKYIGLRMKYTTGKPPEYLGTQNLHANSYILKELPVHIESYYGQ